MQNGDKLKDTPFKANNTLLNYFPYEPTFLIKSGDARIDLYSNFNFLGDIYFDGVNLNGSGEFQSPSCFIKSSFSKTFTRPSIKDGWTNSTGFI